MVLGRVVNKLKLDIVAMPRTLPLIGGAFARRYEGDEPNSAWLGFSSFAWGGERIQVDSLDVPPQALDQPHTLIAGRAVRSKFLTTMTAWSSRERQGRAPATRATPSLSRNSERGRIRSSG
jgi:hypothetical protein